MWKNGEYRIRFAGDAIHEFERVMLSSGECVYFIPMTFTGEDGGQIARYDCSGFAPLSGYRIERTEDALFILEKVLLILGRAAEYLISPARVSLTADTVFYNFETGEIKIAYIPAAGEAGGVRRNLLSFIAQLKKDIKTPDRSYLDKAARLIYYHNYHTRDMVARIGLFRREIYAKADPRR